MWSLLLFASRSSLILAQKVMLNDHQNTVIRLALSRVWPCKTTTTTIVCQTRSSSPFKAFHRHWNAITRCYTADLTSISAMVPASLLLEPRRCNNKNNNNRTRLDAANYSLYRARIHIWTCADLLWRSYRGLYTPAIYPAYVFFFCLFGSHGQLIQFCYYARRGLQPKTQMGVIFIQPRIWWRDLHINSRVFMLMLSSDNWFINDAHFFRTVEIFYNRV